MACTSCFWFCNRLLIFFSNDLLVVVDWLGGTPPRYVRETSIFPKSVLALGGGNGIYSIRLASEKARRKLIFDFGGNDFS